MITYAIEALAEVEQEIRPLASKQWDELRYAPLDEEEFNPDIAGLLALEAVGSLLVFTARHQDELVGYLILLCSELVNHAGVYHASENAMYVDKAYRKAGVATSLITHAEATCKEHGVKYLSFTVTPEFDYSPMLTATGYLQTEVVHTKRI